MKKLDIKRIFLCLLLILFVAGAINNSDIVYAARKKKASPKLPSSIKTYVTYYKMRVGETRDIRVAPRKATIKVAYSPNGAKRLGVSVKSSNSGIVKITKKSNYFYKFTAKRKGSVTLTITTQKNGANGKRLKSKIRLRVDNNVPLRSISAAKNGVSQIRLNFDTLIKDKFDKSKLSISRYDDRDEKLIEAVGLKSFEYVKDDEYGVLLNLNSELKSDSNYHIQYDGMFSSFETGKIGVTRLEVVNKKIPKNIPTQLIIKAFDNEGNDVTNTGFFKSERLGIRLIDSTSSATRLEGVGIAGKLFMIETGSKANIELSYDDIKKKEEITCDDMVDSALNSIYKSTVVYGADSIDWNGIRENDLAKLNLSNNDAFVAVLLKANDGKLISNRINDRYYEPRATFKYSVQKRSKLKVDEKTGAISTKKAGNYGVRVTMNYNGNDYQYYVSIKAEEIKLGSLNLDYPEITVSNRDGIKYVNLRFRDYYGNSIEERDMKYTPSITYRNADSNSANPNFESDAVKGLVSLYGDKKLTLKIDATGRKAAGTYYYEIVIGDPKKDTVKTYLTVKVQDSTTDETATEYRFKEVLEKPNIDLRISSELNYNDIENMAKGTDISLYSYNQFGTSVSVAPATNYRINGKVYDPISMPYIKYGSDGHLYFTPIAIEKRSVNGREISIIKKLAQVGTYNITAEVYNTKINHMQTYSCTIGVTDNQGIMVENRDFKVKRTGSNGATTILQAGMSGTPSMLAGQIVTKMDDSVFIPEVEAVAFDIRYPNTRATYLSYGNRYVIDYVYIPMAVTTRDRLEVYIYQQYRLDIVLGAN